MTDMRLRGILGLFLVLQGCRTPAAAGPAAGDSVEVLARLLVGSYSSGAQAAADAEFKNIELHMARIWPGRSDGAWLYVEQASAEARGKPYRQRVYRLVGRSAGAVDSEVFELPGDPLVFAGAWAAPDRFDALAPEVLVPRQGCTVHLAPGLDGAWSGATEAQTCGSTLRGATYATSEVTLNAAELRSWDRGFDANGTQVWGAVKGPYQFSRVAGGQ
jgi:hypothetical protein